MSTVYANITLDDVKSVNEELGWGLTEQRLKELYLMIKKEYMDADKEWWLVIEDAYDDLKADL